MLHLPSICQRSLLPNEQEMQEMTTMKAPVVILKDKGEDREYSLVLRNAQLSQLDRETGIGIPIGVIDAMKNNRIGIDFCAEVITLGIGRFKRTSKAMVLEAMEGRAADEYLVPCLCAVFIGAGRPEIAESLMNAGNSDGSLPDPEDEKESQATLGDQEPIEGNPTIATAT